MHRSLSHASRFGKLRRLQSLGFVPRRRLQVHWCLVVGEGMAELVVRTTIESKQGTQARNACKECREGMQASEEWKEWKEWKFNAMQSNEHKRNTQQPVSNVDGALESCWTQNWNAGCFALCWRLVVWSTGSKKRNETKRNQTKPNETKRNETKRNETKRT